MQLQIIVTEQFFPSFVKMPCSLKMPLTLDDKMLLRIKYEYVIAVHRKKIDLAMELALSRFNKLPCLAIAVDNNSEKLVERLLAAKWDVNEQRQKDGATPLHAAVATRNESMIKLLISKGAKVEVADYAGNTALAKCLLQKQDGLRRRIASILTKAMGETGIVAANFHDETLLHVMSKNESVPFAYYNYFVKRGIDVNKRELYTGRTFIMDLMIMNRQDNLIIRVIELALEQGLDLNLCDNFGSGLLHRAAAEQRLQVLKWLAGREVNINRKNATGQTSAFLAAKRGNKEILELLYRMGEDVTIKGRVHPLCKEVSLYKVAFRYCQNTLAEQIRLEVHEGTKHSVKTLRKFAKMEIRAQLAKEGTNIIKKVEKLEYPASLKEYILTMESA